MFKSGKDMIKNNAHSGIIDYVGVYANRVSQSANEEEIVVLCKAIKMWRMERERVMCSSVTASMNLAQNVTLQSSLSNYITQTPQFIMPLISQVKSKRKSRLQQQREEDFQNTHNFSNWFKEKRSKNDVLFYYPKEMLDCEYNLVVHIFNLLRTLNYYIKYELDDSYLIENNTPVNCTELLFGKLALGFCANTLNIQNHVQAAVSLLNNLLKKLQANMEEYKQADEAAQAECAQSIEELKTLVISLEEYCRVYMCHFDGSFMKSNYVIIAQKLVVVLKDVIEKLRQAKMNVHFLSLDAAFKTRESAIYISPEASSKIMAIHEAREYANELFYTLVQNDIPKKQEYNYNYLNLSNVTLIPFLERRHGA